MDREEESPLTAVIGLSWNDLIFAVLKSLMKLEIHSTAS